jgi:hypothetical protein
VLKKEKGEKQHDMHFHWKPPNGFFDFSFKYIKESDRIMKKALPVSLIILLLSVFTSYLLTPMDSSAITVNASRNVTASQAQFKIELIFEWTGYNSTIVVPAGGPENVGINVSSIAGFSGPVSLSLDGLPPNTIASFTPNPVIPPPNGFNISVLQVVGTEYVPIGTYNITVYAQASPIIEATSYNLYIKEQPTLETYDYSRPSLVPIDQHKRKAWCTHWCNPTATGISLWSFSDFRKVYEDAGKTEEDLINDVGKALGVNPYSGINVDDTYLQKLKSFMDTNVGKCKYTVSYHEPPTFDDLKKEFIEKEEDVTVCIGCFHRVTISGLDKSIGKAEIIDPATGTRVPTSLRVQDGKLQIKYNNVWENITKLVDISPTPVGGISFSIPIDKFGSLAPYIGLYSTILVATVATAIYVKRRKQKE